jgi:hypothetical protein
VSKPDHRLKLDRADEHLKTLDEAVKAFRESKPYRTITKKDPQTGDYIVRLQSLRRPPDTLSPLIGDILFNLRSSLDHVVYALAVLNGATISQREASEYPVFPDAAKFASAAPGKIGALRSEAQAIIERSQPYNAPDPSKHLLRVLHDLNRIDKHRLLHVVQTVSNRSDMVVEVNGQVVRLMMQEPPPGGFQNNAIIARYHVPGAPKVNMEPEVACDVCFGSGTQAEGESVTKLLRTIRDQLWMKVLVPLERFMPRF